MVSVSNTRWSGGSYVKNGILRSGVIPGKDENGNWSSPHGVEFDIEKEKLTDEMTITINRAGTEKELTVKLQEAP